MPTAEKEKQRYNSYMQHTFNINIYTEFNLKDVILAINFLTDWISLRYLMSSFHSEAPWNLKDL